MKESPHEPLSEEADKRETTICIVYASVVVFGMLALLLHGIAFLSWTEPTMEEIYRNKRMDNSIKTLKKDFETHKHKFWSGKVK